MRKAALEQVICKSISARWLGRLSELTPCLSARALSCSGAGELSSISKHFHKMALKAE
jgi:hypothetical protein